jgi:hypothetical protein
MVACSLRKLSDGAPRRLLDIGIRCAADAAAADYSVLVCVSSTMCVAALPALLQLAEITSHMAAAVQEEYTARSA